MPSIEELRRRQAHNIKTLAPGAQAYSQGTALTPEQAAQMPPAPLPAAGYQRTEELKRRDDQLAQQAETIASQMPPMGTFDPNAIREEPEILRHVGVDPHTGAMRAIIPGLQHDRYAYTRIRCRRGNNEPDSTSVSTAMLEGWQTIPDGEPEGVGVLPRDAFFNSPRHGDTILMRRPIELHRAKEAAEQQATNAAIAARRSGQLPHMPTTIVHNDVRNDPMLQRIYPQAADPVVMAPAPTLAAAQQHQGINHPSIIGSGGQPTPQAQMSDAERAVMQAAAAQTASQAFTDQVKSGTVGSMEIRR